jgi:hypothetical protein
MFLWKKIAYWVAVIAASTVVATLEQYLFVANVLS